MADEAGDTAQLQFTVLYGSHGLHAAHCYLLEVSGVKILLDCGWDSSFDVSLLEPLEKIADKVALVLISHANLEHLGALPYAYRKFKLTAPCYLTSPVIKLGQLALYDAVLNGTAPYTLDDIDMALSTWKELKYKQPGRIDLPNSDSIVITPHASGRTLGGAVWSIVQEPILSVLYVSDVYLKRERFLDGLDIGPSSTLPKKPTLLIQDAITLSKTLPTTQRLDHRDEELLSSVMEALRRGGDVLIPVDSSSRVLEILLVLDEAWTKSQLQKSYELVFLTRVSSLVDMANTHLEWAARKLQELTEAGGKPGAYNPLRFAQVAIVDSFEDAFATSNAAARKRPPRVIVCGGADLESNSFSREVFIREICQRSSCLVLIACESFVHDSISRQLVMQRKKTNKVVKMMEERWVDLEGEELVEYMTKKKALEEQRERERETEVELMDFEQNVEQDALALDSDIVANEFAPGLSPTPDLKRAASLTLERGGSVPNRVEPLNLRRAGSLIKDGHEEILSFTFVPPSEIDAPWDQFGQQFDIVEIMGDDEAKRAGLLDAKGRRQLPPSEADSQLGTSALMARTNQDESKRVRERNADLEDMGAKKKVMVSTERVVKCDVKIIDFDGRMSGEDLFEFVDYIKPRKLVVVRTTANDAEQFAADCQSKPSCVVGLAPGPGECLDISADSSVVRVRIADDTLQNSQAPITISGFSVQRLRGKLALRSMTNAAPAENDGKRRRVLMAGGELPTIFPFKEGDPTVVDSGDSYFVSKKQEPNWGTIMDRLTAANIEAKLRTVDDKPVLLCGNDQVVIWKPGEGQQFIVGGTLCDTYFAVRKALYGCFALV